MPVPLQNSWNRCLLSALLPACLLLAFASAGWASQSVTLAWDISPSAETAGYRVHYGTWSGSYTETLDVGNSTSAVVPDLQEGVTYYFVATAYNSDSLESTPSNEVSFTPAFQTAVTYALTVENGTGDGDYGEGSKVTVTADPAPEGQRFAGWEGDKEILLDPAAPSTSALIISQDVTVSAAYVPLIRSSPRFLAVVSRKNHGPAGELDIALQGSAGERLGAETRQGNRLTLVATFDRPIVSGEAIVVSGRGFLESWPQFDGNSMKIELAGVADRQLLSVNIRNVTASDRGVLGEQAIRIPIVCGDVNGDDIVSGGDVRLLKGWVGTELNAQTTPGDVDLDGEITPRDVEFVNSLRRSGSRKWRFWE